MAELRDAAQKIDEATAAGLREAIKPETDRIRNVAAGLEAYGLQEPKPLNERIANAFIYHSPKENQVPRYTDLRDTGRLLAEKIDALCPASPEKSTAIAKLREAVMWANASIACNE